MSATLRVGPAGLTWGARYDSVATATLSATQDAVYHDGKPYENVSLELDPGPAYREWTAAASGAKRGENRVIVAGEPSETDAIYFCDQQHRPIRIGPRQ